MNLVSKFAGAEARVREDRLVQGDGGFDSLHHELAERALHLGDGFGAVAAVDDELGDQRVVVGRDDALGVLRRVDADAVAAGNVEGGDLAGGRRELCGCSALMRHSMAWPRISSFAGRMASSRSPAAMRNCALTRSTPVMASVTGCSTWMRVFISMK